jgi:NitT/TauT family transport system permease protein
MGQSVAPLARLFVFRGALSRSVRLTAGCGTALLAIAIWWSAPAFGWINPVFLPSPVDVAVALWTMITQNGLLTDAGISIARVWVAFLLSAVMAIPIGIMMSSYKIVGSAFEPLIDFIRYLPVPALVPLSIIWFGIGEETKIFLLWLGTFFQLVLLVAEDMKRVPQEYFEIAYTLGAKPRAALTSVALRSMLPSLVDNLRITLGWCWTYLIIAEIVAADNGLGFVIWTARRYMETSQVMAGVFVIGVIGLLSDQAFRLLHRLMFRYL